MPNIFDITNKKFGRLTAIKFVYRRGKDYYWLFKCDCGKEKIIRRNFVTGGKIVSCGCYHKEKISLIKRTHHLRKSPLYKVWDKMKQRCFNKNCCSYKNYGGRGITICNEWKNDFKAFYDRANKNGYKKGLSIDRINNNGNYEPSNCHWATPSEQVRNRRNNVWITYKGQKKLLVDWLKFFGKGNYYLKKKKGMSDKEIFDEWSI